MQFDNFHIILKETIDFSVEMLYNSDTHYPEEEKKFLFSYCNYCINYDIIRIEIYLKQR